MEYISELIAEHGIVAVLKAIPLKGFTRSIAASVREDDQDKSPKVFNLTVDYSQLSAYDLSGGATQDYRIAWANNTRKKGGFKQWDTQQTVTVTTVGVSSGPTMEDICVNVLGREKYDSFIAQGVTVEKIYQKIKALLNDMEDLD